MPIIDKNAFFVWLRSPSSDEIFPWDFFKTNSTDRDLLIPHVFMVPELRKIDLKLPPSWGSSKNEVPKRKSLVLNRKSTEIVLKLNRNHLYCIEAQTVLIILQVQD